MHGRQGVRLELCQSFKDSAGVVGIRHVIGERAGLRLQQGFSSSIDDAGMRQWLANSPLMKKIRAEQGALRFFEEHTGIPTMRKSGRASKNPVKSEP